MSDSVTETAPDSWQWELELAIKELASSLAPPGSETPNAGMTLKTCHSSAMACY